MMIRHILRRLLPYPARLELTRVKRLPMWWIETPTIARTRLSTSEQSQFGFSLACHSSPLERTPGEVVSRLQQGKEQNVGLAADCLDGLLLTPNQVFSYHHAVGRPSRLRGFRLGLELHQGEPAQGIGGGCCQVSNTLYILALRAGMKIVERHRHGLDLFPDNQRTVPFGCGATVFYNYADLRFENPLPQPVLLRMRIDQRSLVGELWTTEDPGWTSEVYEVDHRFFREGDTWMRENRIRRRFVRADGSVLLDQEIAHNCGRVLYEPTDEFGEEQCSEPQ